jgi:hypothetical protein
MAVAVDPFVVVPFEDADDNEEEGFVESRVFQLETHTP